MNRIVTGLAFVGAAVPAALGVRTVTAALHEPPPSAITETAPFRGPPWIAIEHPVNPYDQSTRDAFIVVHAYHHGDPTALPLVGTAEGIVSGQRRTVRLNFQRTSRTGVFAVRKQWPTEGIWTLVVAVNEGTENTAQALVDIGADGAVASVRVPTRQQGIHKIPAPVAMPEVDRALRARAAQLEQR